VEQDERIAAPRATLTARACRWAIEQIRREHASVNGIRRQFGTGWRTVWDSVKPLLQAADQDLSRFEGVAMLGVDEDVWHHVSTKPVEDGGRGPKELTGRVDLTCDQGGRVRARLLDLVSGRSGQAYTSWLRERGEAFRAGVQIATLDPFHGYRKRHRRPAPGRGCGAGRLPRRQARHPGRRRRAAPSAAGDHRPARPAG
jgi:hypothetical protein